MASPGVIVRHAEGTFASPIAGGELLATLRSELRLAERVTRGDEDILTRAKVRRRTPSAGDLSSPVASVAAEREPRTT
jgi:hypothetical protein